MTYAQNKAQYQDILTHLLACDDTFTPRLSSKVDLKNYALKLAENAHREEAWEDKRLVGLVGIYLNGRTAFITNVSVLPSFQGRGIGLELVRRSLLIARTKAFTQAELEVSVTSSTAIALYKRCGFAERERQGDVLKMLIEFKDEHGK